MNSAWDPHKTTQTQAEKHYPSSTQENRGGDILEEGIKLVFGKN